MYLTNEERQVLLKASADGVEFVNQVVQVIRRANPGAFHTNESLSTRIFLDQPVTKLPHCGFFRFAQQKKGA